MKILRLEIENFRHIKNQNIEFGEKLTVIAWQNSTGKSSLLGWIAQAFDFKHKSRTLNGNRFKSKYAEIFHFYNSMLSNIFSTHFKSFAHIF